LFTELFNQLNALNLLTNDMRDELIIYCTRLQQQDDDNDHD